MSVFSRRLRIAVAITVVSPLALVGCGDSSDSSAPTSTTVVSTSTTSTSTTSTTSSTTTTTAYSGPPTLAPGEDLPQPEALPPDGTVEPEVIVGELVIPALMMTQVVYRGVSTPTLDKGVGWWPGTALPGHVGNVVLAGHRVSHQKPFRHIDLLNPGDEVYFTTDEGTFVYAVERTLIVAPTDTWIIDQSDASTLTMFACHPPHSTKQRIVVVANYVRQEPAAT